MALDFPNSTGHYLSGGSNPTKLQVLGGTQKATWCAWIRYDSLPGSLNTAFALQCRESGWDFFHSFTISVKSGGAIEVATWTSTTGSTNLSGGSSSSGTWYFVAGTLDTSLGSNQLKLWVDGSNVASATQQGTLSSNAKYLLIGANNGASTLSPGEWWDGQVYDARVFKRALSADELEAVRLSYGSQIWIADEIFHAMLHEGCDGATPSAVQDLYGTPLTIVGSPTGYASSQRVPTPKLF